MQMENRPVSFTYFVSHKGEWINGKGTFIKWGADMDSSLGKPIQITFAVVEDEDGQVRRIREDQLKFTDKGPVSL